eukprot:6686901-Alexandrium_andersonii.AAC.1
MTSLDREHPGGVLLARTRVGRRRRGGRACQASPGHRASQSHSSRRGSSGTPLGDPLLAGPRSCLRCCCCRCRGKAEAQPGTGSARLAFCWAWPSVPSRTSSVA